MRDAIRYTDGRLIWVSLPHATYGLLVAGGVVVDAAPIARWMVGRDERMVAEWLRKRGARLIAIDDAGGP